MEFESGGMRVVPFISLHVVVLTAVELRFFVAIVPAERVNKPAVVHSWEECLFVRHLCFDFQLSVLIHQISVS